MKTAHGIMQGYNSQPFIDGKHQVIVHAQAFGRGQDHAHGPPMLDGALKNLQSLGHGAEYFAGKIFTADTNYHSETNLRKCQELELDAYIPNIYFRRRDPRYVAQRRYLPRRQRFTLEDFHYEEAADHYFRPQGKRLRRIAKKAYAEGMVRRIYVAEARDCQRFPVRMRCLTARTGKRRYLRVPIRVPLVASPRISAYDFDVDIT